MTTTVQDIVARLRQPLSSLQELEGLLAAPLLSLKVPLNAHVAAERLDKPPSTRQLATLQSTILAHICPTWEKLTTLIEAYFIPFKSEITGDSQDGIRSLVLSALTVLTATPLSPFAIPLLEKLVAEYPLDDFWKISHASIGEDGAKWDSVVRAWMSIPGKVANTLLGDKPDQNFAFPRGLDFDEFAKGTCLATERIIWSVAGRYTSLTPPENELQHLSHLLSKLISTGHFSHASTSFFSLALPHIHGRFASTTVDHAKAYTRLWPLILQALPGPLLQTLTTACFMSLDSMPSNSSHSSYPDDHSSYPDDHSSYPDDHSSTGVNSLHLHPSQFLCLLFGPATKVPQEVWHVIIGTGKAWNQVLTRSIVVWASGMIEPMGGTKKGEVSDAGLVILLEHILTRWTHPQYVSRALLSEHRYLTSLLVLTLGALSSLPPKPSLSASNQSSSFQDSISPSSSPPSSPQRHVDPLPPAHPSGATLPHPLLASTSTSPAFLRAVGTYLSQRDEAVRRCGMLVAEIVAEGKLNFGDWGEGGGREDKGANEETRTIEWQKWAAELRAQARDTLGSIQEEVENWEKEHTLDNPQPEPHSDALGANPAAQPDSGTTPNPANDILEDTSSAPDPDSDDDSLIGYGSPSPTSSRAPSPTPSELEDPTLRRRPIPRPVYLAELGAMLLDAPKNVFEVQPGAGFPGFGGSKGRRGMGITGGKGGGDAEDEKARIDMALEVGAELIRRKRGYGSELEENAVNLAFMFMGLQDNFELEKFEERRQAVLVALVACCPSKAAPTIIEQFFHHQYSTAQRFTMLNALAIGARELAGLPIPPPHDDQNGKRPRVDFPSKVLPGRAHLEYLASGDLPPIPSTESASRRRIEGMRTQVSELVRDLSGLAIARSKEETEDSVPQVVRERALKVGSRPGRSVVPLGSGGAAGTLSPMALGYLSPQTPVVPFAQVAAEHFVVPFINRFWAHLRTSLEREKYANAQRSGTGIRTGTGTGLVLSPLVLAHLLGTLAVLLHASRHAPAFLHVLAPDAIELALAVGTRPMSHNQQPELREEEPGAVTEAGVLTGALELALTVLDGALEMDGGRVFALERTELLIGVGQWASAVFEALDKGEKVPGRGGAEEEKAVRVAAGLVLTAERVMGRWRRSMIQM